MLQHCISLSIAHRYTTPSHWRWNTCRNAPCFEHLLSTWNSPWGSCSSEIFVNIWKTPELIYKRLNMSFSSTWSSPEFLENLHELISLTLTLSVRWALWVGVKRLCFLPAKVKAQCFLFFMLRLLFGGGVATWRAWILFHKILFYRKMYKIKNPSWRRKFSETEAVRKSKENKVFFLDTKREKPRACQGCLGQGYRWLWFTSPHVP